MPKFDKILITAVLATFMPSVTGELDAETVYELLTKRIDSVMTETHILKGKMNEMDKLQVLKLQIEKMDDRINSVEQQIEKLGNQFGSFEENTEKISATVKMLIETMNNNTETRKLETDIERSVNTQALTVRKMLSDEKSILRDTVEEFSRNVHAFRDNISIQISAFVKGVQAELIASNRSFEAKLNELFEVGSKNSVAVEKDIRKLSADISSTSEDLNMTLRSEIKQLNNYLNTSLERMKVIYGQWSSWSSWGLCSETCTKTRQRHCTISLASEYGLTWQGTSVDKENCNTFACEHTLFVRLVPTTVVVRRGSWPIKARTLILEVSLDEINWGTVCSDGFDAPDARVACRMLGYSSGSRPEHSAPGKEPNFLSGIECMGNETSLLHCKHHSWKVDTCNHKEVVNLLCT